MNLVQINERLKDLPLQAVQQYANGMNPEIPPYLALAEIQRRQKMQQQMANAQGAAQGQQPSVKEQIEQKAGLLGLQQAQMQQQQAQMMQPRPGPVPAGVPQPEPQPQAQEMAGGGIARIPVRNDLYRFAGGGIIAFQEGGDVAEKYRRESEEMGEGRRMRFSPEVEEYARSMQADRAAQERRFAEQERLRMLQGSRELAPERPVMLGSPDKTQETMRRVGPMTAPKFSDPRIVQPAGLAALTGQGPAPAPQAAPQGGPAAPPMPRPAAPAPQGIAAVAPERSPYFAKAEEAIADVPKAPTPQGIIEEQRALAPAAMQEEAMQKRIAEQRARAEGERTAFEKTRPSGLDDLIRVFGQAGQYKGLSGTGPAYTAMQQQNRAEELAMEKRQNELMTAIEGREYEGGKELFGARTKAMDAANRSYQERLKSRTETLATLANADQRSIDSALDRVSREQIAKLQAATANRPTEAERIEAQYLKLIADGKTQEAEDYLNRIIKIKGGAGAAGMENAQTRARRQNMAELQAIIKDEGMQYSDEEKREAAREYRRLALLNVKEGGVGPSAGAQSAGVDKNNPLLK